MSYQIDIPTPARIEIASLPGYIRAQARTLIRGFRDNPRPARAKELRGKPGIYRIWLAGRWRIVYQVDDQLKMVRILRIRLKEHIDYESL